MIARRTLMITAAVLAAVSVARSGHELPVYPSYYPHEIEITAMPPGRAAEQMSAGKLHAYIGSSAGLFRRAAEVGRLCRIARRLHRRASQSGLALRQGRGIGLCSSGSDHARDGSARRRWWFRRASLPGDALARRLSAPCRSGGGGARAALSAAPLRHLLVTASRCGSKVRSPSVLCGPSGAAAPLTGMSPSSRLAPASWSSPRL